MISYAFTVFDQKAGVYHPPFFQLTAGMAQRTFTDCVNDRSHQFGKHPQDYTLFAIGYFDDNKGHFEATPPETVCNGVEVVRKHPYDDQAQLPLVNTDETLKVNRGVDPRNTGE